MGETVRNIIKDLNVIRSNPMAIQRYAMDLITDMMGDNYKLQHPTSPFVFLLEASAVMCTTLSDQAESIARGLYPQMSTNESDLYRHMSDSDYLNIYARPSSARISLVLLKRDILNLAIDTKSSFRQMTIPRETEFSIGKYKFGIYYPVDIRITSSDAIRITYDTSDISPIHTITDVKINWSIFSHKRIEYVYIELPIYQFALTTRGIPINVNTGMDEIIEFNGMFYYCRVYNKSDGKYSELKTTHSTDVYDPVTPTAVLTIMESSLRIVIPQIYFFNNRLGKEIRVDIYSTEGELSVDLGNFSYDSYGVKWRDLSGHSGDYVDPLGKLTSVTITSDSVTSGGGNGLSYLELRSRVLTARHRRMIPVSNSELSVAVSDLGYTLIKSIDDLSGRIFHVSKLLPPVVGTDRSADGMISGVFLNNADLDSVRVYKHESKYVLLPGHLYELINERVVRLTDEDHARIMGMDDDGKIDISRQRTLLYQCLHYVVDETGGYITLIPYKLNNPSVTGRWVKAENISTPYHIVSDTFSLKGDNGLYTLRVKTKSSQAVKVLDDKQVHAQLAFFPIREAKRTYVSGIQIGMKGDERIYEFKIESKLDIDRNDIIRLEGFTRYIGDTTRYSSELNGDYEILFAVSNVGELASGTAIEFELKDYIGMHLLPPDAQGITAEHIGIELGKKMDLVLSGCRSTVEPESYSRYEVDVPDTYSENVYKRDENNRLVLIDDPITGNRVPIIRHKKGDIKEDEDGNVIYKHRAGEVKLDSDDNPIVSEEIGPSRYLELLMVDGKYLLATEPSIVDYNTRLPVLINDYLQNDIYPLSQKMLERTEIYYTPKKAIGSVSILITNTERRTINGHQSISISYYVTESVYQDDELRASLISGTRTEITRWLNAATISKSDLTGSLRAMAGNDILGVDVSWHGELEGVDTFTLIDEGDGITIANRLVLQYDGTLAIEDLIEIEFLRQL